MRIGIRKEIDLTKLIDLAKGFSAFFNREMPGLVYKTGPISVKQV